MLLRSLIFASLIIAGYLSTALSPLIPHWVVAITGSIVASLAFEYATAWVERTFASKS